MKFQDPDPNLNAVRTYLVRYELPLPSSLNPSYFQNEYQSYLKLYNWYSSNAKFVKGNDGLLYTITQKNLTDWNQIHSKLVEVDISKTNLNKKYVIYEQYADDVDVGKVISQISVDKKDPQNRALYVGFMDGKLKKVYKGVHIEKSSGEFLTNKFNFNLEQNYPNPFNPTTSIKYSIQNDGFVSLIIYDILGRELVTLVNDMKIAGKYEINLDASQFASGVYIYKLTSGSFSESKKMLIMK